ncbi:RidA family protein [Roseospira marina]|nr:RidA family protein [Roseospira marina]
MSTIVTHGNVVYLCGQVGDGATVEEQTRDCLRQVETLLEQAGSSKTHMLQAIIWLADMADFDAMNSVWDAWVPTGHAPARACGEARLAHPEYKVEIIVTAARRDT